MDGTVHAGVCITTIIVDNSLYDKLYSMTLDYQVCNTTTTAHSYGHVTNPWHIGYEKIYINATLETIMCTVTEMLRVHSNRALHVCIYSYRNITCA